MSNWHFNHICYHIWQGMKKILELGSIFFILFDTKTDCLQDKLHNTKAAYLDH